MPLGINSAPATCPRMLETTQKEVKFGAAYIEDIIIFFSDYDTKMRKIHCVKQNLADANVKINMNKCRFSQPSLPFLGHLINEDGVKPDPNKTSAQLNEYAPRSSNDLQSFLES
ncbi:Retrovirus-related Pol polyprotein from transposon opus [Thelohanellus kitauei]|uniref:Retrovirus-related Pol polyprotein from transposon opus n=1 Tax=Thelohanellus kitauei TaxID=669202 RepID=A0A0C2MR02_THEKT|nr:Retrovirus-related Pol polyprotein from transposon opus [Thelohanellus kitauei]